MVDENINQEEVKETKSVDPMQVKVDKFAGYVVLGIGACCFWPFLYFIIYREAFSGNFFVYIYFLMLIFVCGYKGSVLIKKAGGPASANYMDKFSWKTRIFFTLLLLVFSTIVITGYANDQIIDVMILFMAMILIYL